MKEIWKKYSDHKKLERQLNWRKAKKMKICYLFILPFAVFFFVSYILPMITSIFYSFTNFNMLEKPKFVGLQNYTTLLLQDDVNQIAVKNTFIIALITGPIGYILAFVIAWLINELPKWARSVMVVVFYAPSIAGTVYTIFGTLFRGDMYGWMNAFLINNGFTSSPILFLTDPKYIMKVIIPVILWTGLGTGFLSFVAGLKGIDQSQYEAGYIDGIQNRWQELWYITLPNMKPMLMFGAVMQITTAFNVCDIPRYLAGFPSTDYAARTVVLHMLDHAYNRFELGYASAIATLLFIVMIVCNKVIQSLLEKVGQ